MTSLAVSGVFDHLTDPFAVLDPDWKFTYLNPVALRILGGGDLTGEKVWERFPEAVGSELNRKLLLSLEAGEPTEVMLRPREFGLNTDAWFNLRAYPVPDGLVVIAWDATKARRAAEEREELLRVRSEVVSVLQRALLPPALPCIEGVELGAAYVAAGEGIDVGGDFYDVFAIENDGWAFVIGDVTGKGPEAASLTSFARFTFRSAAMRVKRPQKVMRALNEEMLRQTGGERLFTAVYGELEPGLGGSGGMRIRIACAGHPSPLVLRSDASVEWLSGTGMILGAVRDPEFDSHEFTLNTGDTVIFYTDGVTEARSPGGKFLGTEGVIEAAGECAGLSAPECAERVKDAALDLQGGAAHDDIAVLTLKVVG